MKLTRRHKIYLAVFALALLGVIVDRAFLGSDAGGPTEVAAAGGRSPNEALAEVASSLAAVSETAVRRPVADRLKALAESHDLDPESARDAFALPKGWFEEQQVDETPRRPGPTAAEKFAQERALQAVVLSEQGHSAVVDGKLLYVGSVLDGFKLVSVSDDAAAFEGMGERVVLKLSSER